jgi:hypothetical protein
MGPKSLVCKAIVLDETLEIFGLAWRGLSPVARVDVSLDGGQTWNCADILCDRLDYSWIFWHYTICPIPSRKIIVMPRAFCDDGDKQPLSRPDSLLYGNNAVISAIIDTN